MRQEATLRRDLRGRRQSSSNRRGSDETKSLWLHSVQTAVCVESPHTWHAYSIQGGTRPLYIVSNWWGEKNCWRRYSVPNFEEADLARDGIWNFQLSFLVKDRPRLFSMGEGNRCGLLKNRGYLCGQFCRVDRWKKIEFLRHWRKLSFFCSNQK